MGEEAEEGGDEDGSTLAKENPVMEVVLLAEDGNKQEGRLKDISVLWDDDAAAGAFTPSRTGDI